VINYKISSNILLSTLTSYAYEIIGIIRMDFVVIDQMGRHSACAKYLRELYPLWWIAGILNKLL
jgi:hypothetical protein